MDATAPPTDSADDVLRNYESGGVRVIAILPEALAPARWPEVGRQLRELVTQQPFLPAVIDCRQLPTGAVEQTGPVFYELLVHGRRCTPRIEICAVGRADQSTGDAKTFVAPPRLESVEAAVSFLKARNQNPRAIAPRARGISEQAINTTPPSSAALRLVPTVAMLLVTIASLTVLTYSAMISFAQPGPRRAGRINTEETVNRAQVAVQGRVVYLAKDGKRIDQGSLILMWAVKPSPRKIALNSRDIFKSPLEIKNDQFFATANETGEYMILRNFLSAAGEEDYYLLAISATRERGKPPEQKDLDRLGLYFDQPDRLLTNREYALQQVKVSSLGGYKHDILFGNESSPTPDKAEPAQDSAP